VSKLASIAALPLALAYWIGANSGIFNLIVGQFCGFHRDNLHVATVPGLREMCLC